MYDSLSINDYLPITSRDLPFDKRRVSRVSGDMSGCRTTGDSDDACGVIHMTFFVVFTVTGSVANRKGVRHLVNFQREKKRKKETHRDISSEI